MRISRHPSNRLLVSEVIQTSAMDCGPAALKCLLEGFGIPASYGRLREACQTDVDGTSIDTLEEVAVQLGLEAEQVMVPVDHVLVSEARLLPALVVVRLGTGLTHFVVLWRRHPRFLQVMDPAIGRRWPTARQFLDELYVHSMPVAASAWRDWAGSEEFLAPLERRLFRLGLTRSARSHRLETACADPGWRALAALDAATRMVAAVVRAGGLWRGRQAAGLLERLYGLACDDLVGASETPPAAYWSVRPAAPEPDGETRLLLRGAVLVRVRGRLPREVAGGDSRVAESVGPARPLSPDLAAALAEPPNRPARELLSFLRADGWFAPTALGAALALAAGGVVGEALLLRGFLDLGQELGLAGQRLGALVALVAFVAALLLLELPIAANLSRLGRKLEARLHSAFLRKIPRLGDRYFQSRLVSDMAERGHSVHTLRLLPELAGRWLRTVLQLILTTGGILWLAPGSAPLALLGALTALGLPLAAQPLLAERDLRVRSHGGALSRFYLDALLGLTAVRTHGAERAVRREHEGLLAEWLRASLGLQRLVVATEALQAFAGFGLAVWLLLDHLERGGEAGTVLLLVYWALQLPVLGQEIALLLRQYPSQRNIALRLLEPLGAPEERTGADTAARTATEPGAATGVAVAFEQVTVRAAGHTLLEAIDLALQPGDHVAIVGPSGAGKSSLVGVLLGWHRPVTGQVHIDGVPLDGERLERLRRETAWVDPSVQLWNRSLLDNLSYGVAADPTLPFGKVLEAAALRGVLEQLPEGFQTRLGESGSRLSGGEGQRVRFGRGLLRPGVRLAILDEPFRGLDREQRRELLDRARRWWRDATLLCVTHDVGETLAFDRVLVIEQRRLVEDNAPTVLAGQPDSRYRAMLDAEEAVRRGLWSGGRWRRFRLEAGRLVENPERT